MMISDFLFYYKEQKASIEYLMSVYEDLIKYSGERVIIIVSSTSDLAQKYSFGTSELTPGVSSLESGTLYFCYE